METKKKKGRYGKPNGHPKENQPLLFFKASNDLINALDDEINKKHIEKIISRNDFCSAYGFIHHKPIG